MSNQVYKKMDSISHIHKRPDMYVGTNKTKTVDEEIICIQNENGGFQMKLQSNVKVNDGFLRIFLEALSNAIDNYVRSKGTKTPMTKIYIELDKETGVTMIHNDGLHIPVKMHSEENMYIPELIFGHLLSGSNYDDTQDRQTSGRNGLGIKLLNVFSEYFQIEILDPQEKKLYKQKWQRHMKKCNPPKITNLRAQDKKGYTKIIWKPDFSLFFQENGTVPMEMYDDTHIELYRKFAMDAAMITKIPVFWNGAKVHLKSLASYVDLFLNSFERKVQRVEGNYENIEYVICERFMDSVSFVNGIFTKDGGIHLDKFANDFLKIICSKLPKLKIQPKDIKQYFTFFINITVSNPEFSSQSKTKLVATKSNLSCEFMNRQINAVLKWSFIKDIEETNKLRDMLTLKKSEKKRGFRKIDGLDPANYAGTKKSKDCVLILCEGLSAKTYSTCGISKGFHGKSGRNWFGIYPLRGKCLNVRNASLTSISQNKEINDVIQALNLKFNVDYQDDKNFSTLYYGKICIITDADEDGHHICSLLLNFFHKMFPSLLERKEPFLCFMMTPIAKIISGKQINTFYNDYDYQNALEEQQSQSRKFDVKYYKGLGTSSNKEIMESFGEKIVSFVQDATTNSYMDKIFHKKFASERKDWLLCHNPKSYEVPDTEYHITKYFNQDLIKFSIEDCRRSIPNIFDGLKVSQRKILYSVFKKRLVPEGKSMKVAQLAGYCAEQSNYHHGEQCLFETIIKMTHHFPGSNNIPFFAKDGQFGSRLHGGKDAANARYIFTKLEPLTRILFPEIDDPLLSYSLDDGDKVQPDYYVPIIPMILLNGCTGIGTGWSCFVPCFKFEDVLEKLFENLENDVEDFVLQPHYYGHKGEIQKIDDRKYKSFGILEPFVEKKKQYYRVKELPIGKWTDQFKEELELLQEAKKIRGLKNYSTPDKVDFVFEPVNSTISLESLKLFSYLNLNNMVLFTENDKIHKFEKVSSIFHEYFHKRLELYGKRIRFQIEKLIDELNKLNQKANFIKYVVEKSLNVFELNDKELDEKMIELGLEQFENSFDYLLRIPVKDLTKAKYEKLIKQLETVQKEIKSLEKTNAKDLWKQELLKLQKEYYKLYEKETRHEPQSKSQEANSVASQSKPQEAETIQVSFVEGEIEA